jgi:hypothetical protein
MELNTLFGQDWVPINGCGRSSPKLLSLSQENLAEREIKPTPAHVRQSIGG